MLRIVALIYTLLVGLPALAGEAEDGRYLELLKGVLMKPLASDYEALRSAFAASKFYRGNMSDPFNLRAEIIMSGAPATDEMKARVKKAAEVDFPMPGSHLNVLDILQPEKGSKLRNFHLAVAGNLIKALLAAGDGKSAKTAFKVMATSEEYLILDVLELKRGSQSLNKVDGISYDVQSATDAKGVRSDVWFDISAFFGK